MIRSSNPCKACTDDGNYSSDSPLVPKPDKPIPYLAGKTESAMTTYYFKNPEEALKRARMAGKQPGCWYGGITLPSGKKGWAIYKGSKIIEQYAVMK